jgi:hypothetical protein
MNDVLESLYQAGLIRKLDRMFPGCIILKNDANRRQGILDLTILYRTHWAALEVKASANAPHQKNQDYYVRLLNGMSFAAFIYPENEEEILSGLQHTFEPEWSRIP